MQKYYVKYNQKTYGGKAFDPDNPWSEHTTEVVELNIEEVRLTGRVDGFSTTIITGEIGDSIEPGEKAHLVYVIYSSSDAFGRTESWVFPNFGYDPCIFSSKEKAWRLKEMILNKEEPYNILCPWNGFYDRLIGVIVESHIVKP